MKIPSRVIFFGCCASSIFGAYTFAAYGLAESGLLGLMSGALMGLFLGPLYFFSALALTVIAIKIASPLTKATVHLLKPLANLTASLTKPIFKGLKNLAQFFVMLAKASVTAAIKIASIVIKITFKILLIPIKLLYKCFTHNPNKGNDRQDTLTIHMERANSECSREMIEQLNTEPYDNDTANRKEQVDIATSDDDMNAQTTSSNSAAQLLDAHGFLAPSAHGPNTSITHEEAEHDAALKSYGQ